MASLTPLLSAGTFAGRVCLVRGQCWCRVVSERNVRKGTKAIPGRNGEAPAIERDWLHKLGEMADRIRLFASDATLLKTSAT